LEDAVLIRDYLLADLTPDAAKRCLIQLKACCSWALEEGLIDADPFVSMKIRVPKGLSEDEDVNPFTKQERDLIISTFASDRLRNSKLAQSSGATLAAERGGKVGSRGIPANHLPSFKPASLNRKSRQVPQQPRWKRAGMELD
jgi:hypothetical protein